MLRRNPTGHMPEVSETAFIDPTAIICGKVIIEDNVFIGPYAVIRADEVNEQGDMEASSSSAIPTFKMVLSSTQKQVLP